MSSCNNTYNSRFAPVGCKFSPKCGKIRRKDSDSHEKTCPSRPLECPHCKLPIECSRMEVSINTL
jgi:hypothetical protein